MTKVQIPGTGQGPGAPIQADGVHWYPPGPVAKAYMNDDSLVCGIRGPFRSGKSVTSLMKLIKNAHAQRPGQDGWKRRRTAIIRNTYPELRTTTMPSWHQWVPKHIGHWRDAGPPMHHIVDPVIKLDWEIWFIALDRPDDLSKLLSMELSDAYVNEAREVPKAIIDGLTGRVGQFPAVWQGGCDNAQILMDTNSPDTDHWWYVLAEQDQTTEKNRQIITSMLNAQETLRSKGVLKPTQNIMRFFSQPSGRSANAENLRNLRAGYYDFLMAGKDGDFIKVYVDGEYGFVMDGLPMYPEYRDSTHARVFPLIPGIGLRLGLDWGLTPASSISQRSGNGRWFMQDEYVSERLGIVGFAHDLARKIQERYPGIPIVSARGDPSGDAVTPEESTCFAIMRANGFPMAEKGVTNDPTRRREALAYGLRTLVDGEPVVSIHTRCSTMRKALAGGYHRRRLEVAGEARYRDVPDKNQYSHIVEAFEQDLLAGGEDRNVTVDKKFRDRTNRMQYAETEYNVFGHN